MPFFNAQLLMKTKIVVWVICNFVIYIIKIILDFTLLSSYHIYIKNYYKMIYSLLMYTAVNQYKFNRESFRNLHTFTHY